MPKYLTMAILVSQALQSENKISSNKMNLQPLASVAQKAEYQIQMTEVLGSILTGVTVCFWIIYFHVVKPLMPGQTARMKLCVM